MAAVAAAAGEEEPRHMVPAPRVEEMEEVGNAAAEEGLGGDDDEILRFMDSVDGYLLLMDSLSSALRQGFTQWVHHVFRVRCLITMSNLQLRSCKWFVPQTCNHQSQTHIFLYQSGVCKRNLTPAMLSVCKVAQHEGTEDQLLHQEMVTMNQMLLLQSLLLVLTIAVRFKGQDQKHYQSSEHWCLQNYELPKFHLKQHLN